MRKIASLFTMLMLFTAFAFGQNRTISGTVTDQNGDAVPGASVRIKGTGTGTAADNTGKFTIQAKTGDVLLISGANIESTQFTVGSSNSIAIKVKTRETIGTEVIVTSLGISRQKKDLGYAAASISGESITRAKAVNVANGLQGKVSGLNITTINNSVFETVKINLRGIRSLLGDNNPMLLLDGVPMSIGYLSSLNPNDIVDVDILKGTSAAAIYGPDAVNGVIVVTTKKGSTSKPVVTLGTSVQLSTVSKLPDFQYEFGSGGYGAYTPYENWSWGPAFDGSIVKIGQTLPDGSKQMVPYLPLRKEKRKFFNTGVTVQNDISFATKGFYLSVQDAIIHGIVPDDKNRRTGFRMSSTHEYGKFTASFNLNYIQQNFNVFDDGAMGAYNASQNVGLNNGLLNLLFNTPAQVPITHYKDFMNDPFAEYNGYFTDYGLNPYFAIDNWRSTGKYEDFIGNIELGLKATNWLSFTYRAALSMNVNTGRSTSKGEIPTDFGRGRGFASIPGTVGDFANRGSRISSELFARVNKKFGDFKLNAIVGNYFRQVDSKNTSVSAGNLVVPELFNVSNRTGELGGGSSFSQARLISIYGSVGLGYKWANIEFTGRNDVTSLLDASNRSYFYPGVNGAIVLSDAISAIHSSRVISYLKLRGSWNKTGNVTIGPYALSSTFSQASGFPYGSLPGFTANNSAPDPLLRPEFVKAWEAGFELALFKNRVSVEATYFHQDNTDQIIPIAVSAATGFTSATVNAASFTNEGYEFDLKLTPLVKLGQVNINFKGNATYNTSRVDEVYQGLDELFAGGYSNFAGNYVIKGYPAYVFKATDYTRDAMGRVIVGETTGEPTQDPNTKIYGRTLPLWIVGLNPTVSYKNLHFSVVGEYKGGHTAFGKIGDDMAWTGVSIATAVNHRERFVFPNSSYEDPLNPGKYIANDNITLSNVNNFFTGVYRDVGSNFLYSAAAWRIREASISYDFPKKLLGAAKLIKGVSVSLTGRNLYLWVPKSNVYTDPDFTFSSGNSAGVSTSQINPPQRTFGASAVITF
ncbi:MAG: SusC/RagA family TonB-linked outer membrane protein [Chitinophagaceae bacterium]|nr:SusC/RagA family TonB-linked outer membrane protein [Chitinophagaceae bacterium]